MWKIVKIKKKLNEKVSPKLSTGSVSTIFLGIDKKEVNDNMKSRLEPNSQATLPFSAVGIQIHPGRRC